MNITPTSLTVAQLLGSQNEQYVVPAYQRRYSWRRHQVEDLWDDLRILEGTDTHLLGTIVCLTGAHKAGINQLELVDGQQRLTTISILLHCLLDRLRQENEASEAQDLERLLTAKALGGQAQPKIVLDSLDAKQFKRHVAADFAEPNENGRLLEAFGFFRERLTKGSLAEVGRILYRLKNQAVTIRLDVSDAKDAFKLFETINNRGLRLSATDIIKNFILGNAARFGADPLEMAKDKWGTLLVHLDGIPAETFFRQFLVAHLGKRVTKSHVVEEFQTSFMREVLEAESLPDRSYYADSDTDADAEDDGEAESDEENGEEAAGDEDLNENGGATPSLKVSFVQFVGDVVGRSGTYRNVVLGTTGVGKIDRRLRNLRLIRAQPSYGFLMSLRAAGCSDQRFEEVLRLTEAFLLRRHITRERTNDNERVFARLCSIDLQDPVDAVREVYREYDPTDEKFQIEFALAQFPPTLIDRARYCLEQLELARQGAHLELLPGGPDIVHVEHIIPQKIKTKKAKTQFGDWVTYLGADAQNRHPRFVARIGNLTLFAGELNIAASNNPYHRKKPGYLSSAFKLTNTLPAEHPEFRFQQVEDRSIALAELAVKLWPAI
jgi:hypothetical protein